MPCGPQGSVRHVALVTGLKHYLGPFEAYGKGTLPQTPFREDQGRLDVENFYYAQEDAVFAAAARDGFTWSVHRPHTIIGKAVGNAMNMGTTLAVYATLCRETGRPFRLPGLGRAVERAHRHDRRAAARPPPALGLDRAEGRQRGVQRRRTATSSAGAGCGAGSPTGSGSRRRRSTARSGRWRSRWREDGPALGRDRRARTAWPSRTSRSSPPPWHTDADLGRPIEVVTDMSKSRRLGFTGYQPTDDAFYDLFARLRADRLIP